MKKINVLSIMVLIVSVIFMSSLAYAGDSEECSSVLTDFKPSTGVSCYYKSDTNQMNYAAATGHKSGNRIFVTTNNLGDIYYYNDTDGITSNDVQGKLPSAGASNITDADGHL